jgi:hypothetical protein
MSTKTTKSNKTLVNEKMRVLKEFYIVDDDNRDEIRAYLEAALAQYPNRDPAVVLDHAARTLIKNKLMTD